MYDLIVFSAARGEITSLRKRPALSKIHIALRIRRGYPIKVS